MLDGDVFSASLKMWERQMRLWMSTTGGVAPCWLAACTAVRWWRWPRWRRTWRRNVTAGAPLCYAPLAWTWWKCLQWSNMSRTVKVNKYYMNFFYRNSDNESKHYNFILINKKQKFFPYNVSKVNDTNLNNWQLSKYYQLRHRYYGNIYFLEVKISTYKPCRSSRGTFPMPPVPWDVWRERRLLEKSFNERCSV